MIRNAVAVLAVGIAVLAGCGGSPGYRQAVPGTFVRVGGPAPGSPVPLPGTSTARAVTGQTYTATAGRNGRFTLSLPPGSYHVTGRSPLMQSGQMTCAAAAELRVTRGKTAGPVTVVCSIPLRRRGSRARSGMTSRLATARCSARSHPATGTDLPRRSSGRVRTSDLGLLRS